MGWLSWERFLCNVDCKKDPDNCISERLYKTMAGILNSEGYLAAGYEYVNIDDCWMSDKRDVDGRLQPNATRFPSGIKSLADYVHQNGLKLGIYQDCGTKTCGGYPGSLGYYHIDAETFASWEVDMLKLDGCYAVPALMDVLYPRVTRALNSTGREILFSCSWPAYQVDEGKKPDYPSIAKNCNMWRNYNDIADSWASVTSIIDYYASVQDDLVAVSGPGRWSDPDMLMIGNYGLSLDQSKAQMAIWAILAAPLFMSTDLRTIRKEHKEILTNGRVIAINQDRLGRMGYRVYNDKWTSATTENWTDTTSHGMSAKKETQKDKSPLNITTRHGEQTTLPCRLHPPDARVTAVRWSRMEQSKHRQDFYVIDGRTKGGDLWKAEHKVSPEWALRSHFSLYSHPALLKIGRIYVEDTGTYTCSVVYEDGQEVTRTVNLSVIDPPSAPVILDAQGTVLNGIAGPYDEGRPLTLNCEVSGGKPPPQLLWAGSGFDFASPTPRTMRVDDVTRSVIHIESVDRNMLLKTFTCSVLFTPTPLNVSISLDINLLPLSSQLWNRENFSIAGVPSEFYCRVVGSRPAMKFTWWLGSEQLDPFYYEESEEGNLTFTVVIVALSSANHGEMLRCNAAHPNMVDVVLESTLRLNVHYPPTVELRLGKGLQVPVILEERDAYFECNVNANPAPDVIEWFHDGAPLEPSGKDGTVLSGPYLILQNVKPSAVGNYSCSAVNAVGRGDSNFIYLTVQYAPRCSHISASYNDNVTITCEVTSVPHEVEFFWTARNRSGEFPLSSASPISNRGASSVLHLVENEGQNDEDRTLYCRAKNAVGLQRRPCVLRTMSGGQPHALRDCSVSNQSDDRIYVACAHPSPRAGELFTLEVYSGEKLTLNITRPRPTFWIPSLEPGSKSLLLLSVLTSNGKSSPFKLTVHTDPLSAPLASSVKITNDAWLILGTLLQVILPLAVLDSCCQWHS
ncbi:hemicentin-1-like isoform X2 [Ornithodoros turicata]